MFRWGVIGPGNIARKFAEDITAVRDATIVAVASRSTERANAFADAFGVERRYGSYAALLADATVDAIYVATPHTGHHDVVLAALAAGKPVLCEKPLAPTRAQAEEMITAARTAGVLLMEAMWTRFLPIMASVRAWIDGGAIGEVRMVQGSFGFRAGINPSGRLFALALAGGGVLDVGVYPIAFAQWVMGSSVTAISAQASIGETGIDEQAAFILGYSGGRLAVLSSAVRTQTEHEAWIYGTEGRIRVGPPFWRATTAARYAGMELVEEATGPLLAHGFEYEAMEVARCVGAGLIESPGMPHADTLEVLRVCDEIRAQVGVRYPFE